MTSLLSLSSFLSLKFCCANFFVAIFSLVNSLFYRANIIIFASFNFTPTKITIFMDIFKRWNNYVGWGVFAIATLSYLFTIEPTASLWDCSEFIATSYKLEVGHPPGAPLFMMLARLASLLAPSPEYVPMMINGLNAIASGFCILFLFWTITHLARRILHREGEPMSRNMMTLILGAGAVGALAYAYTDTFWFSAVEGEVYALSSMFTALVVWLMLRWEENADRHTSMRWIILIAYLMGLSIGVHILNLLTIPALVMIYFFRRSQMRSVKDYMLKIIGALFVSLLILGVINGVIIPYTVALGAAVDTFAVNSLGLPVNVGMVLFIVALFVLLGWLIVFTHNRSKRIANVVVLCLTMILVGFSSYAMVIIRANANPPMNSNNPWNPHTLLSMLNRDQYGQRPLLRGPYYSAQPLSPVVLNPDVESEDAYLPGEYNATDVMWYNPESGEYEEREVFESYKYPSEAMHLFPRMWYFSRKNSYEAGWIDLVDRHPSVKRSSDEVGEWYEHTAWEDIRFFIGYQMGDMFWRYFMWNFVGRQDDEQLTKDENGRYLHGGWASGLGFIDQVFCGPRTEMPREMSDNAANNNYFFLPLLLGLMGLIYQLNRDWRNFFVVLLLFVMMGIALVVYFNTAPDEPRERDYVYSGAFYAFSIWIGLGVLAVADIFLDIAERMKKQSKRAITVAVVAAVVFGSSVPVVLAAENWDDHDRTGRYFARDIGWNYLQTAPENAIIINYGDNDTFPLWYCQEVEGVRTDVRVMNSSYLGGEWYVDEMKLAANDADGVPFSIPATKYSFVNDWVVVASLADVLDTQAMRELRAKKRVIENGEIYTIRYYDMENRMRSMDGTFYNIYDTMVDAEQTVNELEDIVRDIVESGTEQPTEQEYEVIWNYQLASNLMNGILANDKFVADYNTMVSYWNSASELQGMLNLKEVMQLFNSDEPMFLATDGNRPRILAAGEPLPEGYSWVGKLSPKIDSHVDGKSSDYLLKADGYYIPVDVDAAIAAKIVDQSERELVENEVTISLDKSVITRDHLMMLDLFANFDWKRPLSFTQASLLSDYGIVNYARFNGYTYLFVPICTPYSRGSEIGSMNVDKLVGQYLGNSEDELHQPLRFGNLAQEGVYADYFVRYNLSASRIRENFSRIAGALLRRGSDEDVATAEKLLDRGLEVLPPHRVGYAHSAILPYIRSYYFIGLHHLDKAVSDLEKAINMMSERCGMNVNVQRGDDEFTYFYELSEQAAALQSTLRREGLTCSEADAYLKSSDEAFKLSEEVLHKGDLLAAEYIAVRGEWVNYYMQFDSQRSFSPSLSSELYNAMLDIIEVVDTSHLYSGSFDWVANPDENRRLVDNALSFDKLVTKYVAFVNRLTPGSDKDPYMRLMEPHIENILNIGESLPMGRVGESGYVDAEYVEAMEKFLQRKELRDVIYNAGR